jgi:membrane protein required for colicin V production
MNFAPIDILFAAIVLIFTIRCALRGFIKEFMSMAAIVLGLVAAVVFMKPASSLVIRWLGPDFFPELIAFVAVFLLVFLIIKIFEGALNDIAQKINIDGIDRFLGFLLGIVEGVLLVCIILFLLAVQPLFDTSSLLAGSIFAKYLLPLVSIVTVAGGSAGRA